MWDVGTLGRFAVGCQDVGHSDVGRWTLDVGRKTMDVGRETSDVGRWTVDVGRWF